MKSCSCKHPPCENCTPEQVRASVIGQPFGTYTSLDGFYRWDDGQWVYSEIKLYTAEAYLDLASKYEELIMAVARIYPGESRHETALRYINERERYVENSAGQCKDTRTT